MKIGILILLLWFSVTILFLTGPTLWSPSEHPVQRKRELVVRIIRYFQKTKPDPDRIWTPLNHSIQAQLYQMLAVREPVHQMVLDRNKSITGRIVEERDGQVVFAERTPVDAAGLERRWRAYVRSL